MPGQQPGPSIPNSGSLPPASPQTDWPSWPLHPQLQAVIELLARAIVVIHLAQCHADIGEAGNRFVELARPLEVALRQTQVALLILPRFAAIRASFSQLYIGTKAITVRLLLYLTRTKLKSQTLRFVQFRCTLADIFEVVNIGSRQGQMRVRRDGNQRDRLVEIRLRSLRRRQ